MKLRFALTCLLGLTFLSGCSTVNSTFDSIGGFFNKKGDKCSGPGCDNPSLIDNQQTAKKWHCYGQQNTEDWQCQTDADDSKITSIQPKSRAPAQTTSSQEVMQQEVMPQETQYTAESLAPELAPELASKPLPEAEFEDSTAPEKTTGLLDHPANYYTVQLIALPQQPEVLEYAAANGITTPLTALINSQGMPWHVLLLGIYPDISAAEEAAAEWTATKDLKVKPWIRPLGPLQEAIREAVKG